MVGDASQAATGWEQRHRFRSDDVGVRRRLRRYMMAGFVNGAVMEALEAIVQPVTLGVGLGFLRITVFFPDVLLFQPRTVC